jgi:hypothetical protein
MKNILGEQVLGLPKEPSATVKNPSPGAAPATVGGQRA